MGADQGGSEGFFGERVASFYDERSAAMSDPAVVGPVVELLAGFAGEGGALEFGIGTGRIALPLAERGVRVAGIDNSEAMLARWGTGRPPGEVARVIAGTPETVLARLRTLGDAGAAWCVLAPVGGPGAEARALLAAAAGLPGRDRNG